MKKALILFLITLLFITKNVIADGCIVIKEISVNVSTPEISNQKAIIFWDGENETLILSTSFVSNSPEVAWIIPIESKDMPRVLLWNEGIFEDVSHLFYKINIEYEVEYHGHAIAEPYISWLIIPSSILSFVSILVFALGIAKAIMKEPGSGKTIIISAIMFIVSFVVMFMTISNSFYSVPLSSAEPSKEISIEPVQLLEERYIGNYHTLTINATNASYMREWLQERGFFVPQKLDKLLQEYCDKGNYYFVVAKIRNSSGSLQPITITFHPEKPYYPMKITSANNGNATIDLFILSNLPLVDNSSYFKIKDLRSPKDMIIFFDKDTKIVYPNVVSTIERYDFNYPEMFEKYKYATWYKFNGNVSLLSKDSFFEVNENACEILKKNHLGFLSVITKNASIDEIHPTPDYEECLTDMAIKTGNETICYSMFSWDKEFCIYKIAIETNNSTLCEKITIYDHLREKCLNETTKNID